MAGFRGIGDTATDVKMKQDQMALQDKLAAEARASSERMAEAGREESARQFDTSAEAQKTRQTEDTRRFDTSFAAQQENTDWTRQQEEKRLAEDTRRFEVGQEAAGEMGKPGGRQLSLQEFGNKLAERRFEMESGLHDTQTKLANAQLEQYLAATEEEKQSRAHRDTMAKGAFGSLVISGRMNGGVMPLKAIELFNQQYGDKNTQLVGGGFDENTGLAFFNMRDQQGNTKQLKMSPENQYAAIHGGISKQAADLWLDTFKAGSSARIGMERRRMEMQSQVDMDLQKKINARALDSADTAKQSDALLKKAATFTKLADPTNMNISEDQRKEYATTAELADQAAQLEKGRLPSKPKVFAITPEMQSKYGISPENRVQNNPDGSVKVTWRKGKEFFTQTFAPGEW